MALTLCTLLGAAQGEVIIPKPLREGSRIALVTPASVVKDTVIDAALARLRQMGYEPVVYPHARGKEYGTYPATDVLRASDLMTAFVDPTIDAILCTRGGYGSVRLLPYLDLNVIRRNPKWLVGYSDISVLHAVMHRAGVASIHGPMTKHIGSEPDDLAATQYLFAALTNQFPLKFELPPHKYNKPGTAMGQLVGGNLLTINGLAETEYDVMNNDDTAGNILFIEDVSEAIYAIERVLMRMHYDGTLAKLGGIIVGQFTEYRPSDDFDTMEDMIHYWLDKWGYYDPKNPMPIVFDFPTGHVSNNYPMIVSAMTHLDVREDGTTMTYLGY